MIFSFEGGDGVGKTTVIQHVKDRLTAEGHNVLVIREPGSGLIAEQVRKIIKSHPHLNHNTELMLFLASRSDMIQNVIKQNESVFDIILLDRFIDSTIAYQGYGRGVNIELIERINQWLVGDYLPTKTFYLYLKESERKRRILQDPTREDDPFDEDLDYRQRVLAGYQMLIAQDETNRFIAIENIDLDQTVSQVVKTILECKPVTHRSRMASMCELNNEYRTYRATLGRYGWTPEHRPTLMLKNVMTFDDSTFITDHAWVHYGREWLEANMLLPGDQVEFKARIGKYTKEMIDGRTHVDHRFSGVHDVRIIQKIPRVMTTKGPLYEDLTRLTNIKDPAIFDEKVHRYVNFIIKIYQNYYQDEGVNAQ